MIASLAPALTGHDLDAQADAAARLDAEIVARFHELRPWGLAASIDLGGCDPGSIRDPLYIESFVIALCNQIEMRRFGSPIIVRLGEDPRVCGYSMAQLIETSLISGHFAEESDSAYIDIFSCKPYQPYRAAQICRTWFGAETARVSVVLRQAAEQ